MPQGVDAAALAEKAVWLQPDCAAQGLTFCPRRQIEWFGGGTGKVATAEKAVEGVVEESTTRWTQLS